MGKTKESPKKYICSNPNILLDCSSRNNNRCYFNGECYLKEEIEGLSKMKSNIEKQADLVEEIGFKNLKVKKPITYTEEEVKLLLKKYGKYVWSSNFELDEWFEQNKKK